MTVETMLSPKSLAANSNSWIARFQERLFGEDSEARQQAVIDLESETFSETERQPALELLRSYIVEHRDSSEPAELVAVGAAIRKFVANLSEAESRGIPDLLASGHRAECPLDLELEIVKSLSRQLAYGLRIDTESIERIRESLVELAGDYLRDRLLLKEKFAAVTLHTLLCLALISPADGTGIEFLLQPIRSRWFLELLSRRMSRLAVEIYARDAGDPKVSLLIQGSEALSRRIVQLAASGDVAHACEAS